ncbi:MAG: complex I NDUFA9 subunit family protein [Burkholderiales bacterium]
MKVDKVLVLGGSGFIGRHFVARLVGREIKVTVPSRRRERAKHLIVLPTVDVIQADICDQAALERVMRDHDAVVNLIGILHGDFKRAHVDLPLALVQACRATGVKRLIHMSALGAAVDGPSEYQRTKGRGEQAVCEAKDLDVTVFRPSVVFGPEDRFLNRFASMARFMPVIAVPCPQAVFQPLYVGDLAQAMVAALDDEASHAQLYELGGPRQYTLIELVRLVCALTGRRRVAIGLPDWASRLQAAVLERLPGRLMTRDNYRSMSVPNVTRAAFPFGIAPQPIEAVAPAYLLPWGPRERYPEMRWRARR